MRALIGLLCIALFALLAPQVQAQTCVEDAFEENDSFGQATPVNEGSVAARSCEFDDDYFSIQLSTGDEITIDVSFVHAEGDIDVLLFDPSQSLVASSQSSTDDEQIVYTTSENGIFVIQVFLFEDLGVSEGNDYVLDVALGSPPGVPALSLPGVVLLALLLCFVAVRRR